MSEESYIKAPCCECNGRVSLPLDAVGVDFNCPHCGAGLQMLLKHVCEHCNGKLSFDNNPEAIGSDIECGHCYEQTVLSPSTFSTEALEELETTSKSEDIETSTQEEPSDTGDDKPKRRGPPRPSRRGSGPPRPRKKKAGSSKPSSDEGENEAAPEKIGRRLAGSAGEAPSEEVSTPNPKPKSSVTQSRPAPARSSRIESVEEARAPSPRKGVVPPSHPTEPEQSSETIGNPMNPMSGVVPGSSADNPRPVVGSEGSSGPGPVQRRVAGVGASSGSGDSPSDPKSVEQKGDGSGPVKRTVAAEDDEPRSVPKWALVLGSVVLLLGFIYFLLPTTVEMFDVRLARDIRKYTRFQFGEPARSNSPEDFQWDDASVSLSSPSGIAGVIYVTGSIRNKSDNNYQEVEVQIELHDAQGQLLGHTMDYTNQLGPNVTWSFRAACSFTNAAGAKVVNVVAR